MHKDLKVAWAMVRKFECIATLFLVIIIIYLNRHISMIQAIARWFSIWQNVYETVFHICNKNSKVSIIEENISASEGRHKVNQKWRTLSA